MTILFALATASSHKHGLGYALLLAGGIVVVGGTIAAFFWHMNMRKK